MSTTDPSVPSTPTGPARTRAGHKTRVGWYMGVLAGVAITLGLAAAVAAAGHQDTAAGVVTGGLVAAALAALARYRSLRRPEAAGPGNRLFGGVGDERDHRVHTASLAWVGLVAILLSAFGSAATYLGASGDVVVRTLPFLLLATAILSFVAVDRRT